MFHQAFGLTLSIPDPEEVEKKFRDNNSEPFPFWTRLWPSSLALAQFISEKGDMFIDKSVLEFGAGIGLPSFVASRTARQVLVTDHDEDSVQWMEENIKVLGLGNVRSRRLDWIHFNEETADIILLSDVSYDPGSFDILCDLIRFFIGAGSTLLIAMPERIISSHFLTRIHEHVKFSRTIMVEEKTVIIACLRS